MLIKDMVKNYNDTKTSLITMINGIKNVSEANIYNYINNLDEVNEELNLLNTTLYSVPTEAEDLIVIENDGSITVPQMIQNTAELEGFSVASYIFMKQIAAQGYGSFIETLDQLKEKIDQTVLYQENKAAFGEIDIDPEVSSIKLDTPVIAFNEEGTKIIWTAVQHADSYEVTYKEEEGEVTPFVAVPQESEGEFSISLAEITEPGSYTIEVIAKAIDTEAFTQSEKAISSTHTVIAPAVPLVVTGLAIDKEAQKVTWDINPNAQSYIAKVKDYPLAESDHPLTPQTDEVQMFASLAAISAVGTWTIEVSAIGDGTEYETSEVVTITYEVLAPAVQTTLDASTIEVDPSKEFFTFDPCPETDDVVYTETSGIDESKYTLEKELDSVKFAITEAVVAGEIIVPTIKAVADNPDLFLDSEEMVGKELGRIVQMPALENVLQDEADLTFKVAALGETDQPNIESLSFTITSLEEEDLTTTLGVEEITYNELDNSAVITNFNSVLAGLGIKATTEVELSIVNVGKDEWNIDSEAATGTFIVQE